MQHRRAIHQIIFKIPVIIYGISRFLNRLADTEINVIITLKGDLLDLIGNCIRTKSVIQSQLDL